MELESPRMTRRAALERMSRCRAQGDADETKAAFFLELIGVLHRAGMRKAAFLHADDRDDRIFQALGRMQRH